MALCYFCGRYGKFNTGASYEGHWACDRCSVAGHNNQAFANAALTPAHGAQLAGVLGNIVLDPVEVTAISGLVASAAGDSGAEDIWGLGAPARHHTVPSTNIVIVFVRDFARAQGQLVVLGIGRHVGKGNGEYRIMRYTGRNYRAARV